MSDFSTEFRLPKGCPNCGSHRMRVSQARNPDDKVFCSSCNTYVCLYREAEDRLDNDPKSQSEEMIEKATNKDERELPPKHS
ncbi:hypothetical protein [Modicisalibacter xianhensis]|uniref:Uncharacterized protein n=1 Tax=Modicisalibacter xianhensis TaxID=442341 RepID=A0A1I2XWP5_9GAMM|nr:hypothetical protein [Halomonas xianhensis]TDX32814.1 hypothetical protein DFO67_101108 [Halomonas xianhensis]SFH17835.1 hypothetical protein SAMN04487959_101104 [Halomonas xianhensis]